MIVGVGEGRGIGLSVGLGDWESVGVTEGPLVGVTVTVGGAGGRSKSPIGVTSRI